MFLPPDEPRRQEPQRRDPVPQDALRVRSSASWPMPGGRHPFTRTGSTATSHQYPPDTVSQQIMSADFRAPLGKSPMSTLSGHPHQLETHFRAQTRRDEVTKCVLHRPRDTLNKSRGWARLGSELPCEPRPAHLGTVARSVLTPETTDVRVTMDAHAAGWRAAPDPFSRSPIRPAGFRPAPDIPPTPPAASSVPAASSSPPRRLRAP